MNRITLLGFPIDAITLDAAVERLASWLRDASDARWVHTVNTDHMVVAQSDRQFGDILRSGDLVVADGMPLVWAASWQGTPLPGRVAGADLVVELCAASMARGFRIFFLGGRPGVAVRARENVQRRFPGAAIVGCAAPSAAQLEDDTANAALIDAINASGANTLFIGLGAPKQEKWFTAHRSRLHTIINIGVGASIDFLAGEKRRAPEWMRESGFEWLFRLGQEPGRLWKRYLLRDPMFFVHFATDRFAAARRTRAGVAPRSPR
jgi:N-acetylglucosaminyldiphosphoundecaprenol N-acetyl-beta-D-mannosaminyltransferase